MTSEEHARQHVDALLLAAGWHICDSDSVNLAAGRGVYEYDELIARDKASLDIFWLRDDSLADSDNLPPPEVIAQEIVDDLEAALEQFRLITGDLGANAEEKV